MNKYVVMLVSSMRKMVRVEFWADNWDAALDSANNRIGQVVNLAEGEFVDRVYKVLEAGVV